MPVALGLSGAKAALASDVPDTGRILGAFMAAAIVERRGLGALVAVVGDPFAFWRLYGEVAGSGGVPPGLSSLASQAMSELEKSYTR